MKLNWICTSKDWRHLFITITHWSTLTWSGCISQGPIYIKESLCAVIANALNCTFEVIIIIIMSCRQHGYPWPSLDTSPYHSSPLAGLQGYIPYPHIAFVCKFELVVLLLLGHMWGSTGVHHLRARPCFSSSVLRVWFV